MQFPLNRKVFLVSAVALVAQASFVHAAGFSVNEHSASSMGTAFAGRASNAEDASIGAANPAGIAFLDSQQVTVGSAVVMEGGNFKNGEYNAPAGQPVSSKSKDFLKTTVVPFGHYALPVNEKFTFGLNAYAPFGINIDYDDEFAGRYYGDKTIIETVNLQSTFAYKVQDDLSIGLGISASHISGELTQKKQLRRLVGSNMDAKVTGDDIALTWNLGVIWNPAAATTLGASYHAPTRFKLDGDIKVTNTPMGLLDFKHKAKLEITMPERVMFSGTHQLDDQWTVMADAVWTRWSRLDSVTIMDQEDSGATGGSSYLPLDWKNVWSLSVGASYKVNDDWTLKAGYMYDQSPVTDDNRSVRTPDGDRNWLTAGAKWNASKDLTFEFSAAYVMLKDGKLHEGEYTLDGTPTDDPKVAGEYKDQSVWILAAQLTYRF